MAHDSNPEPEPEQKAGDLRSARTAREWDATAYHSLSEPQFAWGRRVLATLQVAGDETVLDAGCGSGRLTALLAGRVPQGRVIALDRSVNMATVARKTVHSFGSQVDVVVGDLLALPLLPSCDVVFSTATFHWVTDHDRLFAGIFGVLRPGGLLHAQCGGGPNLRRIHDRAEALMLDAAFARWFADWREPWEFATAETTRRRLERAGFREVQTSLESAPVVFPDRDAYRVFVSTVVLRPFLTPIADTRARMRFLERIVSEAAGDDPPYELDYWRLNLRGAKPE